MHGLVNSIILVTLVFEFVIFVFLTFSVKGTFATKVRKSLGSTSIVKLLNKAHIVLVLGIAALFAEAIIRERSLHKSHVEVKSSNYGVENMEGYQILQKMFLQQRNIYLYASCLLLVWANFRFISSQEKYQKQVEQLKELEQQVSQSSKVDSKQESKVKSETTPQPMDDASRQKSLAEKKQQ